MFKSLRRALLGLAVITSATVAVPVTTSVVTASNGAIDDSTWSPATGGFAKYEMAFTESSANVTFRATTAAETSTGGLMVAGYVGDLGTFATQFALVRITSGGAVDTSFDGNGLKVLDRGAGYGAADFIQKSGSDFLVGGWSGTTPNRRAAVVKVSESGVIDSQWGASGWAEASSAYTRYEGAATGKQGDKAFFIDGTQIVMWSEDAASTEIIVHRFSVSTGQLMVAGGPISNPVSINRSAIFGTTNGQSDSPETFVMLSNTSMLIATRTGGANDDAKFYKVDLGVTPAALDSGYGTGGALQTNVKSYHLEDFRFGKNNSYNPRLFLAGSSNFPDTWIVRLNLDGTVDTASFGPNQWGNVTNLPGYIEIGNFNLAAGDFEFLGDGEMLISGAGPGLNYQIRKFFTTTNGSASQSFGNGGQPGVVSISNTCNVIQSGWLVPIASSSNFFLMGPKTFTVNQATVNGYGSLKFVGSGAAATACNGQPPSIQVSYGQASYSGTANQFLNVSAPTVTNNVGPVLFTVNNLFNALPSGLTINPTTGAISGSPASDTGGQITLGITATYAAVGITQTGSTTIFLTIAAAQNNQNNQNNQNPNQPQACSPGTLTVTGSSPVLDTTWGTSGWTTLSVGSGYLDAASLVPTSPPGTYLLISATNGQFVNNQSNGAIDLRKVDASGASVNSFGTNGRLLLEAQSFEIVNSVRIDTSGRIYVSTTDYGPNGSTHYMVRLTSTGELDQTYGTSGVLTLSNLPGTQVGSHAVSAAGEVYVVSRTSGMNSASYVTKYSTSGLDANFANSGTLTTTSFGGRNVALMADGSLLVGGSSAGQLTLRKYSSAGVEDSSWATAGVATFGDTSVSESSSDVLVSGQSIYVAYRVSVSSGPTISISFGVAKLSLSGAVDTTFGVNGGVYGPLRTGNRSYGTTEVLSDGSILMAAFDFDSNGRPGASRFSRFSSTGQMDSAFELAETKVEHGTCGVDSPSIVDIGNGGILFAGGKVLPGFAAPTEAVIGKFSVGAITPGTAGGGFSAGGGNQQAPQNPSNQNPTPPVILPPSTPSVPPTPSTPALGIGAPASPPSPGGQPSLINTNNQPNLVAPPGDSRVVIGGNVVEPTTNVIDTRGSQVPPERRTNAQINEIRQQANELVQNFTESLPEGTQSPIEVVPTPTGAVIRNLVTDSNGAPIDVPAESVVVLEAQGLVLMVGGQRATVNARGEFQIPAGSTVGVVGSGLDSEQYGEFVVMSTPTLIKNFKTEANGTFQESGPLPATVRSGSHTLVVASGDTYVTLGIEVIAPKLPVTGSSSNTVVVLALFTLVFGVILDRSRRIGRNVV